MKTKGGEETCDEVDETLENVNSAAVGIEIGVAEEAAELREMMMRKKRKMDGRRGYLFSSIPGQPQILSSAHR